jgi:multiple antibiotic resistance protein
MSLSDLLLAFTAQFVALDIVGTLPMFIAITRDMDSAARRRIVDQSLLVAFSVALLFLLAGPLVLRSLEIKFYDFRIAGGLILLLVSLADLVGGPGAVHQSASGSTGVVPLAVPLITGPGVLTTIMLQGDKLGPLATLLAMAPNYLLAWFLLRRSDMVTRVIGKDGTVIVSKIAALLLASIAVAMIRDGVFVAVREFQGP